MSVPSRGSVGSIVGIHKFRSSGYKKLHQTAERKEIIEDLEPIVELTKNRMPRSLKAYVRARLAPPPT